MKCAGGRKQTIRSADPTRSTHRYAAICRKSRSGESIWGRYTRSTECPASRRTISSHSTMLRAPPRTNGTKEEHRAILIGARPRVESGGPVRISGSGSSALRSKPRASVGAGEQKVCGLNGLEVRDRPFLEAARLGVDHAERE